MNRLHSTDNPFNGKEPWKYNQIVETVMKNFLKLRHKLVPYLYTMNRRASRAGLPLVQPMYYLEPEREETYEVPNNYYFGTEMMVSPITDKLDPVTGLAGAKKVQGNHSGNQIPAQERSPVQTEVPHR